MLKHHVLYVDNHPSPTESPLTHITTSSQLDCYSSSTGKALHWHHRGQDSNQAFLTTAYIALKTASVIHIHVPACGQPQQITNNIY